MIIKTTMRLSVIISVILSAHFSYSQTSYEVSYSTKLQVANHGSSIFETEKDSARFIEGLYQRLISGALKVSDPQTNEEKMLTADQVKQRFELIDTVIVVNPVTKEEKMSVIKALREISSIKCNEDWAFDKTGHFTKRIKSYLIYVKEFDFNGNYRADMALVKVWNEAK